VSKVLTLTDVFHAAREWYREGATVVLASGCFDPLHLGHVQHLEAARKLGNVLIVGVASDRIVRTYKQKPGGPRRPLMPEAVRAGIVAGLRCVDAVAVNDAACELIEAVKPHVYVKGSEYRGNLTPDLEAEAELLAQLGGRMVFLSGPQVFSSSAILAEAHQWPQPSP
jgi:rfaE bifunctional protein nucleotidyltransferase chain/domain